MEKQLNHDHSRYSLPFPLIRPFVVKKNRISSESIFLHSHLLIYFFYLYESSLSPLFFSS